MACGLLDICGSLRLCTSAAALCTTIVERSTFANSVTRYKGTAVWPLRKGTAIHEKFHDWDMILLEQVKVGWHCTWTQLAKCMHLGNQLTFNASGFTGFLMRVAYWSRELISPKPYRVLHTRSCQCRSNGSLAACQEAQCPCMVQAACVTTCHCASEQAAHQVQ